MSPPFATASIRSGWLVKTFFLTHRRRTGGREKRAYIWRAWCLKARYSLFLSLLVLLLLFVDLNTSSETLKKLCRYIFYNIKFYQNSIEIRLKIEYIKKKKMSKTKFKSIILSHVLLDFNVRLLYLSFVLYIRATWHWFHFIVDIYFSTYLDVYNKC